MKKFNYIKILFAALLAMPLFYACTLSMDEYIVPEEERGFDEPYTVESDYGTVTYQFKDSVIYVTENVQQYIASVNDTILYFMESTPKKWLPYTGCKLAAGISHLLYHGLNNQVLSVTKENGMYKVVTTPVGIDDVYEHLDYCIDATNTIPNIYTHDPDSLKAMGYELIDDSIIIDWNEFDAKKAELEGGEAKTRANESSKDTLVENTWLDFTIDSRDGWINAGKQSHDALKDFAQLVFDQVEKQKSAVQKKGFKEQLEKYLALSVKYIQYSKTHMERNEDKQIDVKYTDNWSKWSVGLEAGIEWDLLSGIKPASQLDKGKIGKREWSKQFGGIENNLVYTYFQDPIGVTSDFVPEAAKSKFKLLTPNVFLESPIFMIGPVGFQVVFDASLTPSITINGDITAGFSYETAHVRNGHEVRAGVEKKYEDVEVQEGKFTMDNIGGNIKFSIGATGRVGVGIQVAGVAGITIGYTASLTAEASLGWNFLSPDNPWYKPSGNVKFKFNGHGDIHLLSAPLGMKIFDKEVFTFANKDFFNWSLAFSPKIGNFEYNVIHSEVNDNQQYIIYNYSLASTSVMNVAFGNDYYPGLRVYQGSNWASSAQTFKDYHMVDKDSYDETEPQKVKKEQDYYFRIDADVDKASTYNAVPYLYKEGSDGKEEIILMDDSKLVELGIPKIESQTYPIQLAQYPDNYNFAVSNVLDVDADSRTQSVDPSTMQLYCYKFIATVNVYNATRMTEWGLKVKVYDPDKKKLLSKKVKINKFKSGRYSCIFTFDTNFFPIASDQHLFCSVSPYWYDSDGVGHDATDYSSKYIQTLYLMDKDNSTLFKENTYKDSSWGNILPTKDLSE